MIVTGSRSGGSSIKLRGQYRPSPISLLSLVATAPAAGRNIAGDVSALPRYAIPSPAETEWGAFKKDVAVINNVRARQRWIAERQAVFAEVAKMFSPQPEPEVIYIGPDEGSPHFGPDFNPDLWKRPFARR
jgi:hypothetical protein